MFPRSNTSFQDLTNHVWGNFSSLRIVPYIDPPVTGSISGIIGAGGNTGAVAFSLCFRQLPPEKAFVIMGALIMGSSLLSAFIHINGHSGLLYRSPTQIIDKQEDQILEEESATELASNESPRSINTAFFSELQAKE